MVVIVGGGVGTLIDAVNVAALVVLGGNAVRTVIISVDCGGVGVKVGRWAMLWFGVGGSLHSTWRFLVLCRLHC